MSQPTPKYHYLNNNINNNIIKKTNPNQLILKEKCNNEVKTPQNSRILKDNPKKLATTFESLLNEATKGSATKPKINTPVHNSISKLATTPRQTAHYESHITNSAHIKRNNGSGVKKPPTSVSAQKHSMVYNQNHNPVINTTITLSKPSLDINPVVNGVDYSEIISRKAELGYSGPGYIVEYNCDPKYIRGIIIQKGFWRLVTDSNYEPDKDCADLGPPMYFQRIDKQENKVSTPGKSLTNYEFNWRPRFIQPDEKKFLDTTQNLDLETQPKAKKSLKWASNLEDVKENSFKLSPQVVISNATSSPIHASSGNEVKRKLRRSFSHNEIVGLVKIEKREYIKTEDTSLNINFDKTDSFNNSKGSSKLSENKENFEIVKFDNKLLNESDTINLNEFKTINNTPVLNNLENFLNQGQSLLDLIKKLNETKDLGTNSTFQILKATNLISNLNENLLKFKDKTLLNTIFQ